MKEKLFYHATHIENYFPILESGLKSKLGGVYLADSFLNAVKFVIFKIPKEDIIVFEVRIKDKDKNLIESFDHSFEFFKCKSWVYTKDISNKKINKDVRKLDLRKTLKKIGEV